jgi:hypothetical protein
MKPRDNLRVYIYLIAAWVVLLVAQHFAHGYLKQGNLLIYAVDSLAPIPIIVLVVVFLVGLFMETREQRSRKQQLLFMKSYMFRLDLRDLYIADFMALRSPALSFSAIRGATLADLKSMREQADTVEFTSLEAMEAVIAEYADAQQTWRDFMDIARENGFEDIFQDMLYIMHFISDFETFKELNPGKLFMHEAVKDESSMRKVMKILGDGIRKYLDYVIELKEKQPGLFDQVVADYELLAQARARMVE